MNALVHLPRRRLLQALILPPAAALVGCAATPGGSADEAALLERANAYWAAIKANDLVKAWGYEAVSKTGPETIDGYLKRSRILFTQLQVQGVTEISGDAAKVHVLQRFDIPMMRVKNMKAEIQDLWHRIDGVWFHAPVANALFQKPPSSDKAS